VQSLEKKAFLRAGPAGPGFFTPNMGYRIITKAEVDAMREKEQTASIYARHPALLRLTELETLRALATSANARIYIGFDKHARNGEGPSAGLTLDHDSDQAGDE
jgi:hypothetical protein